MILSKNTSRTLWNTLSPKLWSLRRMSILFGAENLKMMIEVSHEALAYGFWIQVDGQLTPLSQLKEEWTNANFSFLVDFFNFVISSHAFWCINNNLLSLFLWLMWKMMNGDSINQMGCAFHSVEGAMYHVYWANIAKVWQVEFCYSWREEHQCILV